MTSTRFALFLLLAFLCAAPASARDLFVNNQTGDDRFNGEAETIQPNRYGPMKTITRALKAARTGDRIIIANTGEAYRESLTLQASKHSGTEIRRFQIIGNGATIDGTVAVDPDAWRHDSQDVFSFKPHLLGFQQLYFEGKPLQNVELDSVDELSQLDVKQWSLIDDRIYFRTEKDRLPQAYNLSYCGHSVGITLYSVENVDILDLTIQGFQLDAVNAHDNVFASQLSGCTLRGNGRSGVHVGGASRVTLDACLIGSNGKAQVHISDYCKIRIQDCDVIDTDESAPAVVAVDKAKVVSVQ